MQNKEKLLLERKEAKFNTPSNRAQLKQIFDNKKGISLRKASKKLKCSKSTISNT